jgi:ribonuclease HI
MPFGLKNAGATYQRLVNCMFKDQIGRNIEVYVDDMLVKSRKAEDHLKDLQQTFEVLKRYGMKLNPAKCTFGVSSGKFLGFMVSERGIEANPEKIRAIIDMQPPRTAKEMQKLAGKLAALNRFISRSTDRCAPFFKTLRRAFEWTEECATAFAGLKEYLTTPPVLSQSFPGEPLYVYLAVSQTAVSSALVAERPNAQQPVYYTSRALQGAEMKYPSIEKLAFALVTSARKLRPYFQAHPIKVLTEHPLRQALQKPETSGRLVRWSVELSEFDIEYRPRTAIKGQVIADFIAEFTEGTEPSTQEDLSSPSESWFIDVDGSSNKRNSGAGLVITAPNGLTTEYAIRFGFEASNNVAEYEALLAGLSIALDLHAEAVTVRSDSKLVVGQLTGEFTAKGERMKLYAEKAWALRDLFKKFEVVHIPRDLNGRADQLARLATAPEGSLTEGRIPVRLLHTSSITRNKGEVNQINLDEIAWAKPEAEFLLSGSLPEDQAEAKKVRRRAARFTIIDDVLYKRSYIYPLLRCVSKDQGNYILREVHEGVCGNHSGARMLTKKVLRAGYYWPTMKEDAMDLVKKCRPCQEYSNIPHQPPQELTSLSSPWPFAQWGVDIVGPSPQGKGRAQIHNCGRGLLHKMGRGSATGFHH